MAPQNGPSTITSSSVGARKWTASSTSSPLVTLYDNIPLSDPSGHISPQLWIALLLSTALTLKIMECIALHLNNGKINLGLLIICIPLWTVCFVMSIISVWKEIILLLQLGARKDDDVVVTTPDQKSLLQQQGVGIKSGPTFGGNADSSFEFILGDQEDDSDVEEEEEDVVVIRNKVLEAVITSQNLICSSTSSLSTPPLCLARQLHEECEWTDRSLVLIKSDGNAERKSDDGGGGSSDEEWVCVDDGEENFYVDLSQRCVRLWLLGYSRSGALTNCA